MSNDDKRTVFAGFMKKATERLAEKKKVRYRTLHIPSLEQDIKIRGLSVNEIMEIADTDTVADKTRADRSMVYETVVEPNLKELAKQMKEDGKITDYLTVTDIFEYSEIQEIAAQALELSGYTAAKGKNVTIINEIKN
jgi:predicted Mrr-cat superfamily restriction endonuclease